ncbi:MAG: hypothetical protein KME45_06065 [Stenomitos rutilans HA7619-LM2]|jgi:hypothetical protein|nr:hypothetical protein [Stenomitos rutilans HA7619-LM2]
MTATWQFIGTIPSKDLTESRVQLHYAIQLAAAVGATLKEPLPDASHTTVAWNPDLKAFVDTLPRSPQPFQVVLDPARLTLHLLNQQREAIASLPLTGNTMAEGLDWLKQAVSKLGIDTSKIVVLDAPPDDFPTHPLAQGARFDASHTAALNELTAYYANTHSLLERIVSMTDNVSAIRTWPHQFDMAILITLAGTKDGNPLTIGVGLSPGDTSYDEPYWYVSPYPYPDTASLPALDSHGFWHTQHWVGAVLTTSQLPKHAGAKAQQQQVEAFLNSALEASIALLQSAPPAEV